MSARISTTAAQDGLWNFKGCIILHRGAARQGTIHTGWNPPHQHFWAKLAHMEETFHSCQGRLTPFFLHGKLVQNDTTVRHHFKYDATMKSQTRDPALEAMEGMYSFDSTPMDPAGTETMICLKPVRRHTWSYHAVKAWYFAPSLKHYCVINTTNEAGTVRTNDM